MPKLYEGCWGVTRDKTVHGPIFRITNNENFWIEERGWFRPDGTHFRLYEEMRKWDILHVFPTESAARAYLSRPSRWRRAWAWLWSRRPYIRSRPWWNGFGYGLIFSGLINLSILLLTSCSPRVTDPCVTARPPVIGGGLMDTVGVVDSGKGGCE